MFADVFGNSPEVRVLDFLMDHVGYDYTITDVARETGVSRPTLYKMWDRLIQLGLIRKTRRIGNAQLYELDNKNPIVKKMEEFDFSLSELIAQQRAEASRDAMDSMSPLPVKTASATGHS